MLKVTVKHSEDPDSKSAIAEILQQCQTDLAGLTPQAGILFAALDHDYALILDQICQTFPGIQLIGCTTDGEVSSERGFQQDSIVLTLFCSEQIQIRAGVAKEISKDAIAAVQTALQTIPCDRPARLCLTLPAGLTQGGEQALEALQTTLGEQFPIFGGMAADGGRFLDNYQFYNTEVLQDSAPMLLFFGDLKFSHGIAAGWQPISVPGKITHLDGSLIREIDHKPAMEFYRQNMGGLDPSPEHPVAVFAPGESSFFLRAFTNFDNPPGTINCFANIPPDSTIQVSTASREEVLAASKFSMLQALESYPGTEPEAVLIFSCNCRHRMLGTQIAREYELIHECLPSNLPGSGFYTYGEIAPLQQDGISRVHHITIVTLLLGTH